MTVRSHIPIGIELNMAESDRRMDFEESFSRWLFGQGRRRIDTTKREDRLAWPKRSRFYHGKIDGSILKSGAAYRGLKRVHIIVITPYDPFGRDRMIYTIKNVCLEEPGMSYEDDARTIFLYTGGKRGDPPRELRELLRYMEHTSVVSHSFSA